MDQPLTGTETKMERVVNVPCKTCGSEMTYSPEKQLLDCKHCGATREIPTASDLVIETPFSETLDLSEEPHGFGAETKVFHCKGCGSDTAVPPKQVEFNCPFCGSTNVNADAHELQTVRPKGILPFIIGAEVAMNKFKEWIGRGFFTPGALKRQAQLKKLAGVYIPFWTFDADTASSWTAEAGYYYYVTETYTSNGKTMTRQVRHTRWVYTSGYYEHAFDDVLVVASKGVTQSNAEKVYPYDLTKVVNYDSHFILGLSSEVYQVGPQEGFTTGEQIMNAHIYQACAKMIPGDTHRNLSINTRKSNIHFKHLLLPLWVSAYQFKGKTFQFLINGQTGKIGGQKPVSIGKVLLVVGAVIAVGVGLYFLFANK
jgi:predicted RNA-binding Zn-ribbon protein involved in translation (DUF1610 family)